MKKRILCMALSSIMILGTMQGVFAAENVTNDNILVSSNEENIGYCDSPSYIVKDDYVTVENEDLIFESMERSQDLYNDGVSADFSDEKINAIISSFKNAGNNTNVYYAKITTDEIRSLIAVAERKDYIAVSAASISGYSWSYYSNGYIASITASSTISNANFDTRYNEIKSAVDQIVKSVPTSLSDAEKALYVHDYLVYSIEYDIERLNNGTMPRDSYGLYGALVTKLCVCAGYSYAYRTIMDELGIPCEYVSSDEINHAWNIIKINNKWYHVDTTWDDPLYSGYNDMLGHVGHKNFLLTDDEITETGHSGWTADYECTSTDFNTSAISSIISKCFYSNGRWFFVKSDNHIYEGNPFTATGSSIAPNTTASLLGEYNGVFYFKNAGEWQNGAIYSMNKDGSSITNISTKYNLPSNITELEVSPTGKLTYAVSGNSTSVYSFSLPSTGWVKSSTNNDWYYYKADGSYTTGWASIGNKWYYFSSLGVMQKGWQKISNKWYYFSSSGVMQKGWIKLSNKWYYFSSSGVMVTGWQKISNKWYYFNTSGVMLTGWQKISNKWYYMDSNGVMQTSKWISGVYYVKADGSMAVSEWVDGGKYYVGADGKYIANYSGK